MTPGRNKLRHGEPEVVCNELEFAGSLSPAELIAALMNAFERIEQLEKVARGLREMGRTPRPAPESDG